MLLAAMLAMVLVEAVPAFAQTVEGDVQYSDGDNNTNQTANAEQVQYSTNVLSGDVTTDTDNTIGGDVGDGNAIGGGNVDQSLSNESSQVLQQAQADDGSIAFNGNVFEDEDFDGVEDDSDNDGFNDEGEFGNGFNDSDFDGIVDIFDAFFVFGDFDNDGINDGVENSSAAAASAAASGGSASAAASAAASSN